MNHSQAVSQKIFEFQKVKEKFFKLLGNNIYKSLIYINDAEYIFIIKLGKNLHYVIYYNSKVEQKFEDYLTLSDRFNNGIVIIENKIKEMNIIDCKKFILTDNNFYSFPYTELTKLNTTVTIKKIDFWTGQISKNPIDINFIINDYYDYKKKMEDHYEESIYDMQKQANQDSFDIGFEGDDTNYWNVD